MQKILLLALVYPGLICLFSCTPSSGNKKPPVILESKETAFILDTLTTECVVPWGIDFLPDGRMLFTDRKVVSESIRIYDFSDQSVSSICNVPQVYSKGDGGMLDILVHPDYENKPYIYFAYARLLEDSSSTLRVDRAKLDDNCLKDLEKIFEVYPAIRSASHYGGRLQIQDGYLYISMGERYDALDSAQTLNNHFGKILRVHEDGRAPDDNPFVNTPDALPEIWSYGHRNPQGMDIHPLNGKLWVNEHGPQGGDEINLIQKGLNYGWPVITYGEEYGGGPIGEGITEKEGMEQPIYHYTPSIAPSGMTFYDGNAFPAWKGNIFIGALALRHLNRVKLEGNSVVEEERLFMDQKWRVRVIVQGPDDFLYMGVDGGMILRMRPAPY
jgi:glucose/arabinose dehydrogenase